MKCYKNVCLSLLTLIVFSGLVRAQQEIPESIKNKITNGIKYLENAKVPADMDKAVKEFSEAAVIAPGYADVHYFLGKTYSLMQGNFGKAIKEYNKYLEMYPDAPDKDKVNKDIAELEEIIKAKNKSSLVGVSLVGLPDGIYISFVSPNYPVEGRRNIVPVQVGDKMLEINGVKLKDLSIHAVLKLIDEDKSSKNYRLVTLSRAGKTLDIKMLKKGENINSTILYLGEEDLTTLIADAKIPVIVFFVSDWCKPCDEYNRSISYHYLKNRKTIFFIVANVDENSTLSRDFSISKTPTIHTYKKGELFDKMTGFDSDLLKKKIEALAK